MGVAYSQDLRDRVLAAYDRGMKTRQIAEVFDVSPAWARRVKQRRSEHGETTPRKARPAPRRKIDRERLAQLVREQPDATLRELRERLAGMGCVCGEPAISMALKKMGLSFKKDDPRGRAGPPGRRRAAGGVEGRAGGSRPPASDSSSTPP